MLHQKMSKSKNHWKFSELTTMRRTRVDAFCTPRPHLLAYLQFAHAEILFTQKIS